MKLNVSFRNIFRNLFYVAVDARDCCRLENVLEQLLSQFEMVLKTINIFNGALYFFKI